MASLSSRPVVLVTGAARRIGAGIARTLHAAGYDLVLHHRASSAEAATLAAALTAARPDSVLTVQADLADGARLPALVDAALDRFGRLDGLVNNASNFAPTPLGTITPADWEALTAVNARAPLLLSQAAAPALAARQGAIVNLLDLYAEHPLAGHAVYCMAKGAQVTLTRALALELAPHVRVNGVAPGAILWPDGGKGEAARAAILARTPLARLGRVEDIAAAVLWLLRDAAFVTGEIVHVDGGRTLSA
jgi:pteridine reductase